MTATGKAWWPQKPSDFAEGDVIVGRGQSYPKSALRVIEVGTDFIRTRPFEGGPIWEFSADSIAGNQYRKVPQETIDWPIYLTRFRGDFLPEGRQTVEAWADRRVEKPDRTPLFEYWEADRMLKAMAVEMKKRGEEFSWSYDSWRDSFIVNSAEGEEVFRREMVDMPGAGRKMYPIGAGNWAWTEDEWPEDNENE